MKTKKPKAIRYGPELAAAVAIQSSHRETMRTVGPTLDLRLEAIGGGQFSVRLVPNSPPVADFDLQGRGREVMASAAFEPAQLVKLRDWLIHHFPPEGTQPCPE